MEGYISVELLEEWDSIANQDRQDRITYFDRQPETKAFALDYTAPNKLDGTDRGPNAPIHELRDIA